MNHSDVNPSDNEGTSIAKSLLQQNKEAPNPTCFSNKPRKQYMTQDDYAETFIMITSDNNN